MSHHDINDDENGLVRFFPPSGLFSKDRPMRVKAEIIPQHVVSTHKMDTGLPENPQELIIGKQIVTLLSGINFKGIPLNFRNAITSAERGELQTMPILHAMAAVLHADHQHAVRNKDETRTLVSARMFNRVTDAARNLRNKNNLPNLKPFEELAQGIRDNLQIEQETRIFDLDQLASSLYHAVHQLKHEDIWFNRLLPSRRYQPYTSIGLFFIPGEQNGLPPIWVTQLGLNSRRTTTVFSHMHGLSLGFQAPLGDPQHITNVVGNVIWKIFKSEVAPNDEEVLLREALRVDNISNEHVGVIPTRWAHSIYLRKSTSLTTIYPSLAEMAEASFLAQQVIEEANFGLLSNIHVYRPMKHMVETYSDIPAPGVWEKMGVLAINHGTGKAYMGNMHAMSRRIATWQPRHYGECCGACTATWVREPDEREVFQLEKIQGLLAIPKPNEQIPLYKANSATGRLELNGHLTENFSVCGGRFTTPILPRPSAT